MTNDRQPIKALETPYRGITYRSRTEARWAVYLDELRIAYEYEPEGMDLGGEWYLPDFWLPVPGVWLEVKGVAPNEREVRLAGALSRMSRCPVLIAVGAPSVAGEFNIRAFENGRHTYDVAFAGDDQNLFVSSWCQNFMLTIRGSPEDLGGAPYPITDAARLAAANRFGVHESPEPQTRRKPIMWER
jgi:hypothetical protein